MCFYKCLLLNITYEKKIVSMSQVFDSVFLWLFGSYRRLLTLLKQMTCTPDKTVFFLNWYLKALTYSAVFVYTIEDLVQKNIPTKLELLLKILYCEPVSFLVFILSHYKPDKILLFL